MGGVLVGLVGLLCYASVVLGGAEEVGYLDGAEHMYGLMKFPFEGGNDGTAMASLWEGIESVRVETGRVRTSFNWWINEVGFLPDSDGGGLAFVEIAGTEFDLGNILVGAYDATGRQIGGAFGNILTFPKSGKPGFFFLPVNIFGPRTAAVAVRVFATSLFSFSTMYEIGFVKWTNDNITIAGVDTIPKNILPGNAVPLGQEPFGTGLALYGRGANEQDFRGYRQVVYTSAEQSPGLNSKQKIKTLCYQSTKATAAFRRKTCFDLGPSPGGSNVGEVCVDIIEGTQQQCFNATFTYADGFSGKMASFGAFKKCRERLSPRTNQATTSPDDPPSSSQNLLVCFNEVEFGKPRWREFIPPRQKQQKRCCNLRRCLNLKAQVVDSEGNIINVTATDYRLCKGTSGDCTVSTKCVKTPAPTPTPFGLWINEIVFNPAVDPSDNSTTVRELEIAGYDWGKALVLLYFDGEGNFEGSGRVSVSRQPPNGEIGFLKLSLRPPGPNAKAVGLIRQFPQDGLDLTELVEFITWKDGPYPDIKPFPIAPNVTAPLREFPPGVRPGNILPESFVPLNTIPGGTALIKVGTGSSILDFNVEQIINENTDPQPAALNPGQSITLPTE